MRSATSANSSSESSKAAFLTSAGNKFKSVDIRVPSLKKVNHASERFDEVIAELKSCQGKFGNEKKKISLTQIRDILSGLPDGVSLLAVTPSKWAIVDTKDIRLLAAVRWYSSPPYIKSADKQSIHRFLLDDPEGMQVDHFNGNPLDNRRENLRVVTCTENHTNLYVDPAMGSTGYRGVHCIRKRYGAKFSNKYLGTYDTATEAAQARDQWVRQNRGEYALYNFPRPGERNALTGQISSAEL